MPIHVILGKPGSGKSLYATSRLIDELVHGERNVVTNLPLKPDRLNEYLQERYPNVNCRLLDRLRILSDDEMREFWKFRGPDWAGDKDGANGVAYFLDEAHIAFNARDWANLGRGALHYLSQHRKLGDIVWPITQAPGNLDKQFRSVAEDFTVLRNEYTAKFGVFRGRGRFVRKTYLSEPSGNAEPFETASFVLDKDGIASCYDTAKGIGVHGNKADIGRRAKGIPIILVVPGALLLALCCVAIPMLLGRGVKAYIEPEKADTVTSGVESKAVSRGSAPSEATATTVGPPHYTDDTPQVPLYVTGIVIMGHRINVQLSDGRVLTEKDSELSRPAKVERNSVTLATGERLFLREHRYIKTDRQADKSTDSM